MENATKALIIAGAVMVAILIISLTLVVYRQGAEAISNIDLSEAEQARFNGKFLAYQGTNVAASQVNALLVTVLSHNQNETNSGTGRYVQIEGDLAQDTGATAPTRVTGSKHYTVTCSLEKGLVTKIDIQEKP